MCVLPPKNQNSLATNKVVEWLRKIFAESRSVLCFWEGRKKNCKSKTALSIQRCLLHLRPPYSWHFSNKRETCRLCRVHLRSVLLYMQPFLWSFLVPQRFPFNSLKKRACFRGVTKGSGIIKTATALGDTSRSVDREGFV